MSTGSWGRLLPRLVARGMLDGDAALAGRVTVEPRTRSHHVAVIRQDARAVCVAKHHRDSPDPGDAADTEVAVYRWLAATGLLSGADDATVALAPTLLDVVDGTLLLEARDGDLALHLALADGTFEAATLLAGLGGLLGRLHAASPPEVGRPTAAAGPPWVLALADAHLPPSLAPDPRIVALAGEVAEDAALSGCLRALSRRWPGTQTSGEVGRTVLVHGDVKFDNVLVAPASGGPTSAAARPGGPATPRLRLLDWELAGAGLAAWDLAGVVDGLLVPALQVLPTRRALAERGHATAALEAYREVPGAPALDEGELALATVGRLLQSAVQLLAMRHEHPGRDEAAAPVLAGARALAAQATVRAA